MRRVMGGWLHAAAGAVPMQGSTARKALLSCGIAAAVLYAAADLIAGLLFEGYSFKDQHISELGAVGASTRPLLTGLLIVQAVLMGAFALGVWRSAGRSRALRWTSALLLVVVAVSLFVAPFAPMNPRGTEGGGVLHLVYITFDSVLIMVAMGLSGVALGGRFRLYAVGSIVLMLGFGAWGGTFAKDIEAGLPTPWAGVIERVSVYAYLLWLAVLALVLIWHRPHGAARDIEDGMH